MEILSPPSRPSPTLSSLPVRIRQGLAETTASELGEPIGIHTHSASLDTERPLEIAANLLSALEPHHERSLPYVIRSLRLHLDLALFQHFSHPQLLPQGLEAKLRRLTVPSNHSLLKYEIRCALKACQALSSPAEGYWGDYGRKLAEILSALQKSQVLPDLSDLSHLRRRVSSPYADTLFLFWLGRLKGPLEAIKARVIDRKREREVALCSVGVLAQYAWEGEGEALDLLCELGGKGSRGAVHWPIRLCVVQHVQALQICPEGSIAQASKTFLIERESEESHPHVREAILGTSASWNQELGLLEFPAQTTRPLVEHVLEGIADQNRLEDKRLIAYAKEHPHTRTLDLSGYQGITSEGLQEALRVCTQLDTLVLQGHPHIKLSNPPRSLATLSLAGSPVSDAEIVVIAQSTPRLETLILDDCPNIAGKGFERLTVRRLSLNRTGVRASRLKPIVEKGMISELSIDDCPGLDLSFLARGSRFTHLSLRGQFVKGLSLTDHYHLTSLDLEGAHEVSDTFLTGLPASINSLNLRGSLVTAGGIGHLWFRTPRLRELHLEGAPVKGEDLIVEGEFSDLRILSLDGMPGCEEIVSRCPGLQQLTLSKAGQLKNKLLMKIVRKRSCLTHLSIEGCPALNNAVVRSLTKECPDLTELEVGTGLSRITELYLDGSAFGDQHVELILKHCTGLQEVDLSGCRNITGKGLKRLIQVCPRLRELDVDGCAGITPDDILNLGGLKELTYPLLASLLKAFPNIGQLNLAGCSKLEDEDLGRAIQKGRLVHTLDLSDCQMGRIAFKAIKEAGALESLGLQNCGLLNVSDLRNLAQNPNLRYVNLAGCGEVARTTSLNLEGCILLRDSLLRTFTSSLPKLEALVLKNCSNLSSEGMPRALAACPELKMLDLRDCPQIEKRALSNLFQVAQSLEKIFFGKAVVTRETAPKPTRWPGEHFMDGPRGLPPRLAGIYKGYLERHHGSHQSSQELQSDLKCYIPLRAAEEGAEPRPLEETIHEFVDGNKRCLLLTGDSGAGKSLSLRHLEAKIWEGEQSNSNNDAPADNIPLLIDLKGVKHGEADLPHYALKELGYTDEQIQELKGTTKFLFLLDGYDELGASQQTPLEELLPGWHGKSVVSCRTQYLDRNPYYWNDWFAVDGAPKCEYTLLSFDQNQIEHYLDLFVQEGAVWTKERYLEGITTIRGLKEVVTSPLLLRLVIEALPRLPSSQREAKPSDIYEKFFESWYERARARIRGRHGVRIPTLDQICDYVGKLAHKMIQLGEFQAYSDTDEWSQFFSLELEEALELAPIRSSGKGGYQFFHKSLIEFFASQHLFRALLMHKDRNNETLQNRHTQQVVKSLGGHPLNETRFPKGVEGRGQQALLIAEPAVLDFLVERISKVPYREDRLLQIVLASRRRPDVSTAAANAITLLNRAVYSFSGLDLSNVQVPYAALDGALMHHTNLTDTVLTGATLTRAQLVGADLTRANLEKVNFGQWPMLKTDSRVNCAVYSLDGTRVALALENETVEIWDPVSNRRLMILYGHTHPVSSVAFHPDGKLVLSASHDWTFRLWDVSSGECLLSVEGHSDLVASAAISPDGKVALTASEDKTARLWDLNSGTRLLTLEGHKSGLYSAAFSPDGKRALTASSDGTARLWDLACGKQLFELDGHASFGVTGAVFSPDGNLALTVGRDQTACLWDLDSGREFLRLVGHTGALSSAVFSADGKQALTASKDKTARLWDLSSGKRLVTLEGHTGYLATCAFSPDGKMAFTAGGDKTARLWDLAGGTRLSTLKGHTSEIRHAAFSPDGHMALTASGDRTARLWDLDSGQSILTLEGHTDVVRSVAFSPDAKLALTSSHDNTARLWNLDGGQCLVTLTGHKSWVDSAVFSPDGKVALTASWDSTACLWDLVSGKQVLTLEGHKQGVSSAVFGCDGKVALTAGGDHTARLWDLASGKQLLTLKGHVGWLYSAAFSPDGKIALTSGLDKTARLWALDNGTMLKTLRGHTDAVYSAVFKPHGNVALTAGADKTARLWDLSSGGCLQVLQGHTASVTSARWNAAHEIITGSSDRTFALWRQINTSQGPRYCIVWRSASTDLVADGCSIEGARMSNRNAVLLEQKGSLGSAVTGQSNSNNRR